jgi:hypothetical protein
MGNKRNFFGVSEKQKRTSTGLIQAYNWISHFLSVSYDVNEKSSKWMWLAIALLSYLCKGIRRSGRFPAKVKSEDLKERVTEQWSEYSAHTSRHDLWFCSLAKS